MTLALWVGPEWAGDPIAFTKEGSTCPEVPQQGERVAWGLRPFPTGTSMSWRETRVSVQEQPPFLGAARLRKVLGRVTMVCWKTGRDSEESDLSYLNRSFLQTELRFPESLAPFLCAYKPPHGEARGDLHDPTRHLPGPSSGRGALFVAQVLRQAFAVQDHVFKGSSRERGDWKELGLRRPHLTARAARGSLSWRV